MTTTNYDLNYLNINQAQKEDVFNDNMNTLDFELKNQSDRITDIENNGTGDSYDDTELRGRVSQNETDIENIDLRVSDLETNGGGTGGSYDDTELRGRISQNETDIENIELEQTQQNTRLTNLETNGGGGSGGGYIPMTGEIKRFLKTQIPTGWYQISETPNPLDQDIGWLVVNNNIANGYSFQNRYLHNTSSLKSFSSYNNDLSVFNKQSKDFDIISNSIFNSSSTSSRRLFNKSGSDFLYIVELGSDAELKVITYNLSNNSYTSKTTTTPDLLGDRFYNSSSFITIDKEHENIYTVARLQSYYSIFISKYNILSDTYTYVLADLQSITSTNSRYSDISMIYFDINQNLIVNYNESDNIVSIKVDKTDISVITDYSSDPDLLKNNDEKNSLNGNDELLWYGDEQILINKGSGNFTIIDSYNTVLNKDNLNIDFNRFNDSSALSTVFFDNDTNIYLRSTSSGTDNYPLLMSVRKLNNETNIDKNIIVDCVYNVPQ